MTNKDRAKLSTALGLIEGSLAIKNMEEFEKEGLIKNLEEVRKLLTEISENYDR